MKNQMNMNIKEEMLIKGLIAEAPVLGLLFVFPQIDISNDTNQQPDRTQDRNRLK